MSGGVHVSLHCNLITRPHVRRSSRLVTLQSYHPTPCQKEFTSRYTAILSPDPMSEGVHVSLHCNLITRPHVKRSSRLVTLQSYHPTPCQEEFTSRYTAILSPDPMSEGVHVSLHCNLITRPHVRRSSRLVTLQSYHQTPCQKEFTSRYTAILSPDPMSEGVHVSLHCNLITRPHVRRSSRLVTLQSYHPTPCQKEFTSRYTAILSPDPMSEGVHVSLHCNLITRPHVRRSSRLVTLQSYHPTPCQKEFTSRYTAILSPDPMSGGVHVSLHCNLITRPHVRRSSRLVTLQSYHPTPCQKEFTSRYTAILSPDPMSEGVHVSLHCNLITRPHVRRSSRLVTLQSYHQTPCQKEFTSLYTTILSPDPMSEGVHVSLHCNLITRPYVRRNSRLVTLQSYHPTPCQKEFTSRYTAILSPDPMSEGVHVSLHCNLITRPRVRRSSRLFTPQSYHPTPCQKEFTSRYTAILSPDPMSEGIHVSLHCNLITRPHVRRSSRLVTLQSYHQTPCQKEFTSRYTAILSPDPMSEGVHVSLHCNLITRPHVRRSSRLVTLQSYHQTPCQKEFTSRYTAILSPDPMSEGVHVSLHCNLITRPHVRRSSRLVTLQSYHPTPCQKEFTSRYTAILSPDPMSEGVHVSLHCNLITRPHVRRSSRLVTLQSYHQTPCQKVVMSLYITILSPDNIR
ncbi:hypothetical protein NDU88_000165 [Pleurodeles waltl]|uniref:Uncharacterized protein n=1 Tax=Pleurodeles waltl TaxID=8319 RepID=A0AAV7P3D5_PLEWA|nr:hypothetical protein NDU88_000165 [Pleurodeles waltl]